MKDIKTFNKVDRLNTSISFSISRLEDNYELRQSKPNLPHRHGFYTVILPIKVKGQHNIDFKSYNFENSVVFFVGPGQVHQIIEEEKSYGFSMVFSPQFLISNNISSSFIEDLNLFNNYGDASPMVLNENQRKKLIHYCEEMIDYDLSTIKFKNQAIGASLKLFLIQCNNICSIPLKMTKALEARHYILKNFKSAVEKHHLEWHSSTQYAQSLNISADHLNRTIKSLIGKTAKEYIQKRISMAAKRMLYFTDLTTKEIGYKLGFSEASNFSAFFKKCTDLSPTEFRKNRRKENI